jgi:hypothetical protein
LSNIVNQAPPPRLTLLDISIEKQGKAGLPDEIVFQFQPGQLTENMAAAWSSSTGMNRDHPILQYSHGEQNQFSFEARLWAANSDVNIEEQLEALKRATRRDEDLKRPPIWQFTWGTFIDETVVVQSVGNIRYDAIRPDGSLRGVTLAITLLVYRTIDVELVAEDRPTDTFYVVTKSGDQWENIAQREYGDAMMGDLLRRRNPALPFPGQNPGKIVKLPKSETLRNEPVEPDSPPLRRTKEGLSLRASLYEARSKSRESTIILKG